MIKYDLSYYEKMLRQNSRLAEKIAKVRWSFISRLNARFVLDYGSGVGWFRAYKPSDVEVDSFDIGPYPQTGILRDYYNLICFWDVLEHISGFNELKDILTSTDYVALSIPIKPDKVPIEKWKHFKPGEHLNYFSEKSLDEIFRKYSFHLLAKGSPECPPREDILSLIYMRA